MIELAKLASLIGLSAVIVPSLLYFGGYVGLAAVKLIALVGTIVWFGATPVWMGRERTAD